MPTFTDQVIVVTGASSGIGRALCLELARERPRLVLAARDEARLRETAQACERLGAETLVVPTDVSEEDQCRRLIEQAVERFGRLDALVNNAGRAMWVCFDELEDLSCIEGIMQVNYFGAVYCTRYALAPLKQSRGRILTVASLSGLTGVPLLTGYSASKHALIGFFESLRIELTGSGVSVTIAAPDFVQSEVLERALDAEGKALGYSPLDQAKLPTAQRCAARLVKAMRRRERLVLTSARSHFLRWGKLLAPGLVDLLSWPAKRRK